MRLYKSQRHIARLRRELRAAEESNRELARQLAETEQQKGLLWKAYVRMSRAEAGARETLEQERRERGTWPRPMTGDTPTSTGDDAA